MSPRLRRVAVPLGAILLTCGSLYFYLRADHDFKLSPLLPAPSRHPPLQQEPVDHEAITPNKATTTPSILTSANVTSYLSAILDAQSGRLPSLECPVLNRTRYESLKPVDSDGPAIRYFFALNLRESLPLLPRLAGSLVEVMRFLGPQHCALSVVEGNSPDGTADVLAALRSGVEALGASYFFESSPIDPAADGGADRIRRLAQLRNKALEPLLDSARSRRADGNTTVLFVNDVAACPEDLLELALQRRRLGGDMACAMDWTCNGGDPPSCNFYDVWIARDIAGDSFFRIPNDASWGRALDLFWAESETRARFQAHRPFQVFSCWNGAVAMGAQPFLEDLSFRPPDQGAGECFQGEPQLLCKDMWRRGYHKIAVVPTVNLAYTLDHSAIIKKDKGFVSDLVAFQDWEGDALEWRAEPPEKVRCMPTFTSQSMEPWNQSFS
ncbi:hypothetical protein CDD83_2189 [Cordyceps sp. RAO-2017]|nr:hypothetical protein CDD83_2189 [Cordyceps sp. RAO-2017]